MESERNTSASGTPAVRWDSAPVLTQEPSPMPGCPECLSFSVAGKNARSTGDYSAVSDMNVTLRRHQDEAHA
jgi:hypothetical protein